MEGLLIFVLFMGFVVFLVRVQTAQLRAFDRLSAKGRRGRALVLSSFRNATGVTLGGRRFQRRQMTIEIDISGQAPYEVTNTFLVPRGMVEPFPGCSLDVAIDPANPQSVAVLGPGGFSGPWLRIGPPAAY